ncbi:hypothetical protein GCM10027445_48970 [Amycolatopsis endophytica]|uniref:Uncharacterized protein n=1 Tax=Amycolatopsis endophytica TaxID=860233 RepID=A0A853BFG2_9PSEU|nr:hypothetical protein [Amycolatopsis endophytica]NYI93412.1 hypothetical protein [Amycolatopsis endophytica]
MLALALLRADDAHAVPSAALPDPPVADRAGCSRADVVEVPEPTSRSARTSRSSSLVPPEDDPRGFVPTGAAAYVYADPVQLETLTRKSGFEL